MGRLWLGMVAALLFLAPALAADADTDTDEARLREPTGRLYTDESYVDDCGRIHIVISSAAVLQFRQEWPAVHVPVNLVAMQLPSAVHSPGATAGTAAAPTQSPFKFEVPGLGELDMLQPGFMDQMRAVRGLAPDEFDAGFREGWQQGNQANPEGAAMAEQLIPMSEGLSVPEALDRIEPLLDIYRTMTGGGGS